ncbi:LOW QUALITY PROTEIN: programmed cell death protein 2-like [Boleophthalmus pectinirostris]|uniref:LOW QUALITY PROTEIN: programmed cell death protein 2-like n=1 Tax=Boleophthalmus pectinirostris TaxID=150288 RepID=UPI00242B42BC|nr:LOW QUALITY PROTEIN: programmed cell death protein 2-like [Boleophthalmus pectinirostris]
MASPGSEMVLVGFCDGELDKKRHQSTFMTNKVGGEPDAPSLLSRHFPRCSRCGSALVTLYQVYCPLEGSPYHRTLHVFACLGDDCSGRSECWRVLRSQCLEADTARPTTPPQELFLSATDWCDSADDWGMEGQEGEEPGANVKKQSPNKTNNGIKAEGAVTDDMDMSKKLEELQLGPSEDAPPCFRPYFISVMEETDLYGEDHDLTHAQELLKDYEKREGISVVELDCCEDGSGEEKYEKTKILHGDAVFARFMKRISVCSEQILRYCRGGNPLFISEPPANMCQLVLPCSTCGSPRTFELQLMPALVSLLQGESLDMQLEFGTVLVYTCLSSCWRSDTDKAVDEFCFVQSDPDQQLFK